MSDKTNECTCPTVGLIHDFGKHEDCEYFDHHCESCHIAGHCTRKDCGMLYNSVSS